LSSPSPEKTSLLKIESVAQEEDAEEDVEEVGVVVALVVHPSAILLEMEETWVSPINLLVEETTITTITTTTITTTTTTTTHLKVKEATLEEDHLEDADSAVEVAAVVVVALVASTDVVDHLAEKVATFNLVAVAVVVRTETTTTEITTTINPRIDPISEEEEESASEET
jgi:carbon starvation protein CstA